MYQINAICHLKNVPPGMNFRDSMPDKQSAALIAAVMASTASDIFAAIFDRPVDIATDASSDAHLTVELTTVNDEGQIEQILSIFVTPLN